MRKVISIICIALISSSAVAQGLVHFVNSQNTLISLHSYNSSVISPLNGAGYYYFALMTAPVGTTDPHQFTFAGITGTNIDSPGRFVGGFALPVADWLPGTQRAFQIVGWSSMNGPTFDPAWMAPGNVNGFAGPPTGYFGVSDIAPSGTAGSPDGQVPVLSVFSGIEGIQNGFIMSWVPPRITISRSGTQAILSWPQWAFGFTLEYSDKVPAASWTPVSGVTGTTVTVDASVSTRFYRLRK